MLTIFCPQGETATWETHVTIHNERKKVEYRPRPHNGRMVIDVPMGFFIGVIIPSSQGKKWQDENFEAMEFIGKSDRDAEVNNAFPGEHRAPLVAPVVTEVAPVILKMRAPVGVTHYSYDGVGHAIGKDGTIEVADRIATVLRSHGFVAA
jgi:hypothetical protein